MKIYLDRNPSLCPSGWTHAEDVTDVLRELLTGEEPVEEIDVTDELGPEKKGGYELLRWILARIESLSYPFTSKKVPTVKVHAENRENRQILANLANQIEQQHLAFA